MSLHFPGHPEAAAPAGYRLVLAPCSLVLLVFHGFGARPDVGFRRHHHYIIYAVYVYMPCLHRCLRKKTYGGCRLLFPSSAAPLSF